MSNDKLIDRMPKGPLSERELQETRHSNHELIDKLAPAHDINEWGRKIDRLWLCLGWLPMTVTNWKALGTAAIIATLLGGQSFIDKVEIFMKAYLP